MCILYIYDIYDIYIYIYIYCVRWKPDIIGYYVQLCSIIKKKSPSKEMNCGGAEVAVTISKLYIYIYYIYKHFEEVSNI